MLLSPPPKLQFFNANGNPLVGGKVFTYEAGTTTPLVTYQDQGGTVANTNPVVLDSRGEANIWLNPVVLAKFILTDDVDAEIWSVDNIGTVIVSGVVDGNLLIKGTMTAEGDVIAFANSAPPVGVINSLPTYDALVAFVNDLLARVAALEGP